MGFSLIKSILKSVKSFSRIEKSNDLGFVIYFWATLSALFITLFFSTYYLINGLLLESGLNLSISLACLFSFYIFSRNPKGNWHIHLIQIVTYAVCVHRVYAMGGINAPMIYGFVLIPIYSGALMSFTWAAVWTLLYTFTTIGFYCLHKKGIFFYVFIFN